MVRTVILEAQDVSGFSDGMTGIGTVFELVNGETCTVVWDETEYTCVAECLTEDGVTVPFLGSTALLGTMLGISGLNGSGFPFAVWCVPPDGLTYMIAVSDDGSEPDTSIDTHTVAIYREAEDNSGDSGDSGASDTPEGEFLIQAATLADIADAIREKTGIAGKLKPTEFPDAIRGITTGGGSSDDVRYVTFMSHDGLTEYGKKPVAVGDDCADPITRGLFDTPTRERDAQYSYTFAGWSTEAGGGLDSNALKTVNEDRTLYANFAAVLRYYTITYYDDDGTTVLKTESLAYGSLPSYAPTKDGYSFDGWEPNVSAVIGDASYQAKWLEQITFSGSSWADISRVCEAGEAENYFAVGDSRTIQLTVGDTVYSYTAKIVGINHDTKADGTKAGISVMFFTTPSVTPKWGAGLNAYVSYKNSYAYEYASTYLSYLPSDLRSVIKGVQKDYNKCGSADILTSEEQLWIPSCQELNKNGNGYNSVQFGELYEYFAEYAYGGTGRAVLTTDGSAAKSFWARDCSTAASSYFGFVSETGLAPTRVGSTNLTSATAHLAFGFCI